MMSSEASNEAVAVAIRVRPLNDRERDNNANEFWRIEGNTIRASNAVTHSDMDRSTYQFDQVFGPVATTASLYESVARRVVSSAMQGINGTIFAYGQTGSGKTHTMQGNRTSPGVIPHALSDIFEFIQSTPNREFCLRVSYIEIYNEIIKDLLDPAKSNLKIHEDTDGKVFVGQLTEEPVLSPGEIMTLLLKGQGNRHVGCTNMNEESSRSHSIFRLIVESRERTRSSDDTNADEDIDSGISVASLHLVDLAGSERVAHSGASGVRLKEGTHINKSLLTLGQCIRRLSEGHGGHIPYRDSKLTRILQSALGGNTRTAIICNVNPADLHVEETLSTLGFASRAKTIHNSVHKNEIVDEQTQIKRLEKEIAALKHQLESTDANAVLKAECREKTTQLQEARHDAHALRTFLLSAASLKQSTDAHSFLSNTTHTAACAVAADKRAVLRRRRTFDPTAFSTFNDASTSSQRRCRASTTSSAAAAVAEEQRESYGSARGSIESSSSSSSSHTMKDELEAMRVCVMKMEAERNAAHEDVARMKNDADEIQALRVEKQQVIERCAQAETDAQMIHLQLRNYTQLEMNAKNLHTQIAALRKENSTLNTRITALTDIQHQYTMAHSAAQRLKCELDEAQLRARDDVEQRQQLALRVGALQTQMQTCEDERVAMHERIVSLTTSNECVRDELNEMRERVELAQEELQVSARAVSEHEAKAVRAESDACVAHDDAEQARVMLDEQQQQLAIALRKVNEQADVLRMPVDKQERFLRNAAERSVKSAEKRVEMMKMKCETLESAARSYVKERAEAAAVKSQHERHIKNIERQLSARDAELVKLRKRNDNTKALHKNVSDVQKQLDAKLLCESELRGMLNELRIEYTSSQQLLTQKNELLLNAARSGSTLNTSLDEAKAMLVKLHDDGDELRAELHEVTQRVCVCEQQRDEALQSVEERVAQCARDETQLNVLREKCNDACVRINELECSKTEADKLAMNVQMRLDEASAQWTSERTELTANVSSLQIALDTTKSALREKTHLHNNAETKLDVAETRVDELEKLLNDNECVMKKEKIECENAAREVRRLRARNDEADKRVAELCDTNRVLKTTSDEVCTSERSLRAQLDVSSVAVETLKAQSVEQMCVVQRLRETLDAVETQCQALREEVSVTTARMDVVNAQLNKMNVRNEELQSEVESVQCKEPLGVCVCGDGEAQNALRKRIVELQTKIDDMASASSTPQLTKKQMLSLVKASQQYAAEKLKENKPV